MTTNFNFAKLTPEVPEGSYPKIALVGATKSGKTLGSLKLAQELIDRKIVKSPMPIFGDTENKAKMYAGMYQFHRVDLSKDSSPKAIITFLDAVAAAGHDLVIIDSASDEWAEGANSVLEQKDRLAQANVKEPWSKLTPAHNAMLKAIESFPGVVIATYKSANKTRIERDSSGKMKFIVEPDVPITRKNFDFRYDCTANLRMDYSAELLGRMLSDSDSIDYVTAIADWAADMVAGRLNLDVPITDKAQVALWQYAQQHDLTADTFQQLLLDYGYQPLKGQDKVSVKQVTRADYNKVKQLIKNTKWSAVGYSKDGGEK